MTNLETAIGTIKVAFPGEPVEMIELGDRVVTSKTQFLKQYKTLPDANVTCKCGKEFVVGDKAVTCQHADDAEKNQVVFERSVRKNKYEIRAEVQYERGTKVHHDREHPTQKAMLTHYR